MGGTLTREATLSNGVSLPKCVALGLRLLTQEMGLPPPPALHATAHPLPQLLWPCPHQWSHLIATPHPKSSQQPGRTFQITNLTVPPRRLVAPQGLGLQSKFLNRT